MIFGTGIDIVETERVRNVCKRWRDRFLRRVLREEEMDYCLAQSDPAPCIAARFAGKEAISKAFGTGIGSELGWHDIEITHHPQGRPMVKLHGRGKVLLLEQGGKTVHISLSHNGGQTAAMAVLEG